VQYLMLNYLLDLHRQPVPLELRSDDDAISQVVELSQPFTLRSEHLDRQSIALLAFNCINHSPSPGICVLNEIP
jgi:hypothetical protein